MSRITFPTATRRQAVAGGLLVVAMTLAGCTAMRTLTSDVSSFGEWPTGQAPGTYAFDRLPSQATRTAETEAIENSARAALAKAGFKPVEAGQLPSVLVQLGAQDARTEWRPWDDPLWWRGGFGYYGRGPWLSTRWGWGPRWSTPPRVERQVAMLIRDRATGKPLYEARASSEGYLGADPQILGAMFEAALSDFPRAVAQEHRVSVVTPP